MSVVIITCKSRTSIIGLKIATIAVTAMPHRRLKLGAPPPPQTGAPSPLPPPADPTGHVQSGYARPSLSCHTQSPPSLVHVDSRMNLEFVFSSFLPPPPPPFPPADPHLFSPRPWPQPADWSVICHLGSLWSFFYTWAQGLHLKQRPCHCSAACFKAFSS